MKDYIKIGALVLIRPLIAVAILPVFIRVEQPNDIPSEAISNYHDD